eukprot:scaffold4126_cov383-Prasinococcus_capsulatus_cf.AAC.11
MLSLAAELNKDGWISGPKASSDGKAAAAHIVERLKYLETSRPTAVNLSEAVAKLGALVQDLAADSGKRAGDIARAFAVEADKMLAEDVATNKAIGKAGAEAIKAAVGDSLKTRGINVLTHCNTGSLATAGYGIFPSCQSSLVLLRTSPGTALGCIRALSEMNLLHHAYCTETRPYNQGSRLTAYELVYEKLPATLIVDSAVSYLMAKGEVDAVVVGADRVANNGDTANKIGTYQLALAAKHHNIPFFVAAPVTTLDKAAPTGQDIVIEERAHEEVTHSKQGKGERVAAEGIGVWNPGFDVTPGALIRGIITERGVINNDMYGVELETDTFNIAKFIAETAPSSTVHEELPKPHLPRPIGFKALDCGKVLDYLEGNMRLKDILGGSKANWKAIEVGDGNINFVYVVKGVKGDLVVKQALPYVRVVGEDWPLPIERCSWEANALTTHGKHCPEHTPEVFHHDEAMGLTAMQYIAPPCAMLRTALIEGQMFPLLGEHLAEYLSKTLFGTSLLSQGGGEFSMAKSYSVKNTLCRITEDLIFTEPYMVHEHNHWTSPYLDETAASLRDDWELKQEVLELKRIFCECSQSLIHGDLHTGSVMASKENTWVFDSEFAFHGPMGFDIGAFIGNLFLSYFSQPGHATAEDDRLAMAQYTLQMVEETWTKFDSKFRALWTEKLLAKGAVGDTIPTQWGMPPASVLKREQDSFLSKLLSDSLGFAGCKMIRRIVGFAHVADLESIKNLEVRASCEKKAIALARQMIVGRKTFSGIAAVIELAKSC